MLRETGKWMGLGFALLGKATRSAAKTAYTWLHYGGDESPFKFSPLFLYSEGRLQILLIGYCLRVAETMSYRTEEVEPFTGWSWWNRALRDTWVVPENSFFRAPDETDGNGVIAEMNHPERSRELLLVFLTHGLCNWFIDPFFKSLRNGGDLALNQMWNPEELLFIKRTRE